jgi:hypothetical protein
MRKSKEFEVWRSADSCRIRRPDPSGNLGALFPHDHANVVLTLQVQPDLRAVAEIAAEPTAVSAIIARRALRYR